jgi:cellobiose-specific phosphotransferase system component IIC
MLFYSGFNPIFAFFGGSGIFLILIVLILPDKFSSFRIKKEKVTPP